MSPSSHQLSPTSVLLKLHDFSFYSKLIFLKLFKKNTYEFKNIQFGLTF